MRHIYIYFFKLRILKILNILLELEGCAQKAEEEILEIGAEFLLTFNQLTNLDNEQEKTVTK